MNRFIELTPEIWEALNRIASAAWDRADDLEQNEAEDQANQLRDDVHLINALLKAI